MARVLAGRGLVVAACLLAGLGSACSPADPPPAPPPTVVSATPSENAQEREQRLAYAAAEKSYREFRAEFNRLLATGGAKEASRLMKETAGNSYLKDNLEVIQAYRGLGYHQEGTDKIVYVQQAGYSPTSVVLATCEDSTGARTLSKSGKSVGRGDIRVLQIDVRRTSDGWKVWSGNGNRVKSCES